MIIGLLSTLIVLVLANIATVWFKNSNSDLESQFDEMDDRFDKFDSALEKSEKTVKDEFQRNRIESNEHFKTSREESAKNLVLFSEQFTKNVKEINDLLKDKFSSMNNQQNEFNKQVTTGNKTNREELATTLKSFENKFSENTKTLNELLRQKFSDFYKQQNENNKQATSSVKEIREAVEKQLKTIREDNTKQLDEMRKTVDEKLQKTLNDRLSQSFETVTKQLKSVQEGLGEMKNLAADVGGLKKVLSNVKMRGGIGEVQLEMLLEQILAPDQYEKNVKIKAHTSEVVEFAIKLPGRNGVGSAVWLPIDAKFPKDIYEQLVEAYDIGDPVAVDVAKKNMETTIKKMAKDISSKYIDPPNTTDFGIMFLPFEGIYAEVIRNVALQEILQRDYKIIVTGPTTLAAILNSLQMGFKTLAIEKRSSEVWAVLGGVKKEFENFSGMMGKAQKSIQTGLDHLDTVMGVRTRAIQKKLLEVEIMEDNNGPKRSSESVTVPINIDTNGSMGINTD